MDRHLQWLKDHKDFVSIRKIEMTLSMPEGTLKKFVDGKRSLPSNWEADVIEWVVEFLFVPDEARRRPSR